MSNLKEFRPLQAPFIKVNVEVTENAIENGKPKIKKQSYYKICPSAKKIATYIVNQILGSDIIVPDTDINWLMPTLQKSLEQAIYSKEISLITCTKMYRKSCAYLTSPWRIKRTYSSRCSSIKSTRS